MLGTDETDMIKGPVSQTTPRAVLTPEVFHKRL